jgi:hypothetical protein
MKNRKREAACLPCSPYNIKYQHNILHAVPNLFINWANIGDKKFVGQILDFKIKYEQNGSFKGLKT